MHLWSDAGQLGGSASGDWLVVGWGNGGDWSMCFSSSSPGLFLGRGLRERERTHASSFETQAQNWYSVTPTEFYWPKQV